MVILGNPPYFRDSLNNNEWIQNLVRDYKFVDSEPLNERNTKGLQDDYVKFIRFGQWRIDQTGTGVLAFITNHAYLDNATFTGMRKNLMNSFDEVYIINLHGNSRKHEKSPSGGNDENVFEIEQGVAITFFVKNSNKKDGGPFIYYCDLWGKKKEKLNFLETKNINLIKWSKISPMKPYYLFVPHNNSHFDEYQSGWKITKIFKVHSNGIVTARDHFTIHWSHDEVWKTVQDFISLDTETARKKYNLREDVRDWKVSLAQKDLLKSGVDQSFIKPILYRPFDVRYTYYTGNSKGFICMPRNTVMSNLLNDDNLALITSRLTKAETFMHAFVSNTISDAAFLSSKSSNNAFVFPLYLLDNNTTLFKDDIRQHNFNGEFVKYIENKLGLKLTNSKERNKPDKTFTPEDILGYIYSILYSESYRKRYCDYLRIDFPNIPITRKSELFQNLSKFGLQLISLHLHNRGTKIKSNFPVEGTNKVTKVKFEINKKHESKIYINEKQYFENIDFDVWDYKIGGYKVCEKWIKYRKNRVLTYNDLVYFQQIVSVIYETIQIQKNIDQEIKNSGGWPLE
ncbi:hypothetical protein GCM10008967_29530 [Bacillus carboniphilus]|uniref:site-specific DNA-methyltransferase (adenine-specific) n=1 Tax=Bacillus carboniphilus TaxID=86663 RepID=A0ABN0WH66_9BACI